MKAIGKVVRFVQQDNRFGIKMDCLEKWINGLGKCPQEIEVGKEAVVEYHEARKGENVYLNYGEPKITKGDRFEEINKRLERIENGIAKLLSDVK